MQSLDCAVLRFKVLGNGGFKDLIVFGLGYRQFSQFSIPESESLSKLKYEIIKSISTIGADPNRKVKCFKAAEAKQEKFLNWKTKKTMEFVFGLPPNS